MRPEVGDAGDASCGGLGASRRPNTRQTSGVSCESTARVDHLGPLPLPVAVTCRGSPDVFRGAWASACELDGDRSCCSGARARRGSDGGRVSQRAPAKLHLGREMAPAGADSHQGCVSCGPPPPPPCTPRFGLTSPRSLPHHRATQCAPICALSGTKPALGRIHPASMDQVWPPSFWPKDDSGPH